MSALNSLPLPVVRLLAFFHEELSERRPGRVPQTVQLWVGCLLVILISMASTCILAEVVRMVTKYNSFKGNSIAYVIFSLGMVGSPLPIWLFKADFLAQITEQGMPADYVAAVEALSSNAMLIVLFVAPIIGGIIGAFIARGLFKKHFVKAGIV